MSLRRALGTGLWALLFGAALWLLLRPLDALGAVLVLPPSYHTGLRLLFGALWVVGIIALFRHARDEDADRSP